MKKRKMLSSYTILFLIIVAVAAFTWIVPAGEYSPVCNKDGYVFTELAEVEVCIDEEQYADAKVSQVEATELAIMGEEVSDEELVIDYEEASIENTTQEYSEVEKNGQGIWQILNSPVGGFYEAVDIALFILVIGGFIGIVMQTGALDAGIAKLLENFKGRENLLIPILMILFGLGGTSFGMAEETIAFYPLIIPIILAAGYDVATGVMIVLLGAGCGVLGSTVNPFAIGAASGAAEVSIGSGIALRFILLIAVEAFAIFYTMKYAATVKSDPSKSKVSDLHEEHVKHFLHSKNTSEGPKIMKGQNFVLIMFALTFVIMVLSVMPWTDFGVQVFENFNTFLIELPVIGKILTGTAGSSELGTWWFGEITMLFLTSSVIIALYAKSKNLLDGKDAIGVFVNGSRDLLGVALIVGLSRGIKIVMSAGAMSDTLLYYGSNALKSLGNTTFVILNYLFYIPMAFLIPSTSGLAGATMPIMGPMGELVTGSQVGTSLVITGYSAASGIVNLITPTSGVVMGGLMISKLPYDRWLKIVAPVLVGIFAITIIVLAAGTLIGI
ncbi:MAG: YfcC family protein [Bacilli bacterium]